MNQDDGSEAKKESEKYKLLGNRTKCILRILLVLGILCLFFFPSDTQLSRWASWTTIVFTVGAVYAVNVEPQFVAWLVERVQLFIKPKRKQAKTEAITEPKLFQPVRKRSWWPFGWPAANSQPVEAQDKVRAPSSGNRSVSRTSLTPIASRKHVGWLILVCLIVLLFLFPKPDRKPDVSEPLPPSRTEPVVTPPTEFPIEPEIVVGNQRQRFVTVVLGDRCYTIAARCTGNGENYVDLGPPVNDWLDVSNRALCLIRPGDQLRLPNDWPENC